MGSSTVTGLDIGGAHLKAARVEGGRVLSAVQLPCALWQGIDRLEAALAAVVPAPGGRLAATMSGELADLFPDRATGVALIVATVARQLGDAAWWGGRRGLLDAAAARAQPDEVGSANWLATATVAAARVDAGLMVDVGSTTTDLVTLAGGTPRWQGWGDRERLAAEELVYTGIARTPLMAVARELPFRGRRVPLMNEHFATMADVWRVLGLLPDGADLHPAADAGAKTAAGSARRLARMVGADLDDGGDADWRRLAAAIADEQETTLARAARTQLSRGLIDDDAPLVVTGSGAFLAERLAQRLGRPAVGFAALLGAEPQAAASIDTCAPAVAVALLASSA